MPNYNRRHFLKLGCKTIAGAGLLANTPLAFAQDSSASSASYRALVCINLQGGNDGFNMLVPSGTSEYAEYQSGRGHLAIPREDLQPLVAATTNTTPVGLHPQMSRVATLFEEGQLAAIANVGTLVQPVTTEAVRNQTANLPTQLYSHHDQSSQWHKLNHRQSAHSGWGARAADILADQQPYRSLASISLSGSNDWQVGGIDQAYNISRHGVNHYSGMDDIGSEWQQARRNAFTQLLHLQYDNIFEQAYADLQLRAMVLSGNVGAALERLGDLQTPVPTDNPLADQLQMVARLIAIKDEFRMNRQLFYVNFGDFDTHDDQLENQPRLLGQLAEALVYFNAVLTELGELDNVTSFTMSDFGRTVTSNGDGTDHGWGNHHWVMGGSVKGGDIYGDMPRLAIDGPDDAGHGRIIPTMAVSQYAATLLRWIGLNDAELHGALPTLSNFASEPQFML